MRSSIRRSTPGIGEGAQSSRAAWTAARAPKSALRSMASLAGEWSDAVKVFRSRQGLAVLYLLDCLDQLDVGRGGDADLMAFGGDHAVDEVDLGAATFQHVLSHRRPRQLAAGVRLQSGEDLRFDFVECSAVTFGSASDGLGIVRADVLELIAKRLADAHPFAGEPYAETADLVVAVHVVAGRAGSCGDPVGHAVDAQLRPAFAPEIGRFLDAVDRADHRRQFLEPLGDAAMNLAHPVDLVRRGALCSGAANSTGRIEFRPKQGRDDPDCLVPADDPGDAFLIHA